MKKLILSILALLLLFLPQKLNAQENPNYEYVIENFDVTMDVKKDTSLEIVEKIKVDFTTPKHGIFRVIPVVYSAKGRTIRAGFKIISITDEGGNPYEFEKSRVGQSLKLKIGDPNKTLTGPQTYVIKYAISKIIQRFGTHDEIYWNVTGSEWDTDILQTTARVNTPYAKVTGVTCYSGPFGSTEELCSNNFSESSAEFASSAILGMGRDFTIVVALDKNNQLEFPSKIQQILFFLSDNWGYLMTPIPILLMFYFWYKRGRDKKYEGDNVYYKQDVKKEITKPVFAREHLPMVYSPIGGLTPSQVGTIADEKVDIHDVVAEIVELARIGYLKIERITTKKLIFKDTDYKFIELQKEKSGLQDFQVYLLEKIFLDDEIIEEKGQRYVYLSKLKNKFYKHLEEFKKRLYESVEKEGYFDGNPDKVRLKWIGYFVGMDIAIGSVIFVFFSATANFFPFLALAVFSVPAFFFALRMPRKTAWGHSLFRQIKGLAYYLEKGKWRHEIAEKHLFFEEVLPLAICLGVVDKLANDMEDLGVTPPSYTTGFVVAGFASDFSHFESSASGTFVSGTTGKSSWSGGSGFGGGGFSGGGFGGGGGGSW